MSAREQSGGVAALLPHRPPWALVDRVIAVEGDTVIAEKRVSAGDPLAGAAGLGGLLLVEALAQTAACLMGHRQGVEGRRGHRGYLVAARGFKFPDFARPGETLTLVATKTSELGSLHGFRGQARAGERELASGELTFAVQFDL